MMRAVRLAIAALIAVALAVLPMSAGLAQPPAGKAEMRMTAPNDAHPGCDATYGHAADLCNLKCCGVIAILVEGQVLPKTRPRPRMDKVAAPLEPFTQPPDPPPPRSWPR
jgi:hypothetical protein